MFWTAAEPWLARAGVEKGTMMGFPCLRLEGAFFASVHKDGTHLIVKVDQARVAELVAAGAGESFAPNGRVFKEWVAVPTAMVASWPERLAEAYAFAGGSTG
jgi:hypothetical protein